MSFTQEQGKIFYIATVAKNIVALMFIKRKLSLSQRLVQK